MKRERGSGGLFKYKNSRNWYAQIYENGRPRRISTRTAVKQEAQAFLRKLLADRDTGKPFAGDLQKVRYEDLRAGLIQNYIERGNKSLQVLADGSETMWGLKVLDEHFKGFTVNRITTDSARDFVRKRLADGVTNSTVNMSLGLMRRMLNIAREDGKIQNVPIIRLLKFNPARKGFLSPEKFEELLGHLPVHLHLLITFLYWCGVRVGEARQIQWSQVDLKAALIRLEDEQTKSGEARTVPLPDVLVEMLEQVERQEGRVFDDTNLRTRWQNACVAAGLGTMEGRLYRGLLIHDLRRTAIRNLMRAGVSEKVAMSISGHKTRSVFDRYHIVDTDDVVRAMRKVQNSESSVRPRRIEKL